MKKIILICCFMLGWFSLPARAQFTGWHLVNLQADYLQAMGKYDHRLVLFTQPGIDATYNFKTQKWASYGDDAVSFINNKFINIGDSLLFACGPGYVDPMSVIPPYTVNGALEVVHKQDFGHWNDLSSSRNYPGRNYINAGVTNIEAVNDSTLLVSGAGFSLLNSRDLKWGMHFTDYDIQDFDLLGDSTALFTTKGSQNLMALFNIITHKTDTLFVSSNHNLGSVKIIDSHAFVIKDSLLNEVRITGSQVRFNNLSIPCTQFTNSSDTLVCWTDSTVQAVKANKGGSITKIAAILPGSKVRSAMFYRNDLYIDTDRSILSYDIATQQLNGMGHPFPVIESVVPMGADSVAVSAISGRIFTVNVQTGNVRIIKPMYSVYSLFQADSTLYGGGQMYNPQTDKWENDLSPGKYAMAGLGDSLIFAGTVNGLYEQPKGDTTWKQVNLGPWKASTKIGRVFTQNNRLYISKHDSYGYLYSYDAGHTWSAIPRAAVDTMHNLSRLNGHFRISQDSVYFLYENAWHFVTKAPVVNPYRIVKADGNYIIQTQNSMMWTTDLTKSWQPFTNINKFGSPLSFFVTNKKIMVAYQNYGLYQADLSNLTGIEPPMVSTLPQKVRLEPNYPNPFNPTTTFRYTLPHAYDVHFIVYNILGRKVMSFDEGRQSAGQHQFSFNAGHLASGVYLMMIHAGSIIKTQKFTLLK